jgi:hypothetical protein
VLKAAGVWIKPFHEEVRTVTNQNETGKAMKAQDKPLGESALKAAKPSDVRRELTDDAIAAVAGGLAVVHGGKMNPS